MIKIIDLKDDKIVIAPECLVIEPFKSIWTNDKSKQKTNAYNEITYIWFYSSYNSPFFQHDSKEKHDLICEYIIKNKDFKVNKNIQEGIEVFNKINTTPSIRLFIAVQESIVKMEEFFKNAQYNEENITKIQKAIVDMPKLQEAIQTALENCKKEQSSNIRVRGEVKLGMFE